MASRSVGRGCGTSDRRGGRRPRHGFRRRGACLERRGDRGFQRAVACSSRDHAHGWSGSSGQRLRLGMTTQPAGGWTDRHTCASHPASPLPRPAPVVKWISHRPPEPGVEVRFLSGALRRRPCPPPLAFSASLCLSCTSWRPPDRAGSARREERLMEFPKCQKCRDGVLIPLSDYGQEGSAVIFKAWACTDPDCGFSLRVDKGEVSYGKKIEQKR